MAYFTEQNTEGFAAADRASMNEALDRLAADGFTNDEDHISDFINNAYQPGKSADEYIAEYRARFA